MVVGVIFVGASCSTAYRIKQADKKFAQGAYSTAIEKYRKLLPRLKREQQTAIHLQMAKGYFNLSNMRQAESYYERVLARYSGDTVLCLYLAQCKLANEKYADAVVQFDKYLEAFSDDKLAIAQRDYSVQMQQQPASQNATYIISNAKELNSSKDDFAPAYLADDHSVIAFTSVREAATGKKKNIITGEKNSDIFFVKQTSSGRWESAALLKGKKVNTKHDEGVCTFTHDFQTMYFTQCVNSGSDVGCHIYTATYDDEGQLWENVERVKLADTASNSVHPSLSNDELELYFSSNREGGLGGMDIWKVTRSNGNSDEWSQPVNLGPDINTEHDETFPYIHANGTLYFASDGHAGFGGLDIFKARSIEGGWEVVNMGFPINSSADDFAMIMETEQEAGYFSSRRLNARGGDDIYRFVRPDAKFMFVGKVKNYETSQPMADTRVSMISNTGESLQITSNDDGMFSIYLAPETDYIVYVRNENFFNQKTKFTTKNLEEITTLRNDFLMQEMDKIIELENIFYDFAKWDLRPESAETLDQLVEVLNDNPTISIQIVSHTDTRGDTAFNNHLSQQRAQSVVNYVVSKGIEANRLQAMGMGKSQPRIVTSKIAQQYKFLKEGDELNEEFIRQYVRNKSEEEIVDQLNRRTEFSVTSQNNE
ncbi:cell envelope biogenesis protein OmpA [Bacteroidia bacterium]|nr:cell envelope biogenesis protein OmpA [Bacteroidia bacterium]